MFDFVVCVLTNFFRIFLLDKFVSAFLGKDENRKTKKYLFVVFFCHKHFAILGISYSMDKYGLQSFRN